MQQEQEVKLISYTDLKNIDKALGACYDKGEYEGEEVLKRILRVCNNYKHKSMLRFLKYVYDVELSTSALLEWTRHQVGVDYAVRSSRYTIKKNIEKMAYIKSNNDLVNDLLRKHMEDIYILIKNNPELKNDDLKLLLPQGYAYRMIVQFNGQSLQHFINLRSSKSAHYHIRELAISLFNRLPKEHQPIFNVVFDHHRRCNELGTKC